MRPAVFITLFLCSLHSILAQSEVGMASPTGQVSLKAGLSDEGKVQYAVFFQGKQVILPSSLGFVLGKPAIRLDRFQLLGVDSSRINAPWSPLWGEESRIENRYAELILHLQAKGTSGIRLDVVFRVFDDGVGFRYVFPRQPSLNHFVVADELTEFALAGNHTAFWIPGDYDTNEYTYETSCLTSIDALAAVAKEKDIAVTSPIGRFAVQTPLMMRSADGLYLNLHEASLLNYPAMHLVLDTARLLFSAHLTPDAVGNKAYLQAPFSTPWRTIVVAGQATGILASRLILNLNEPSRLENMSWIRPQKFAGMWWEMHIGKADWPLASGKHGANTANVKKYIDFAARHGLDGVLVEGWNAGWEDWFGNWKEEVFDFVTPYPDYDLSELTRYARQKGVKLIMHHETSGSVTNYERRMDTAFRFMQVHGMNTVKTGYVGRIIPRGEHHDSQWMVNHYQRVAEKAAAHQIMVVAHEPVRPTGLHRTFPNWMANEAARGSEFHNAPTLGMVPEHTTILPFTRLMGGPMDFTPGFFHFQLNQFDSTRTQRIRTTLAKQLALYVTVYSPVQMVPDLPENYAKYPDAFQFIADVPVDWEQTRYLAAEPGDYVAIARKEKGGTSWFLGAITDENERSLTLSLDFLDPAKTYEVTLYRDAAHAHYQSQPEAYVIEKRKVTSRTRLDVLLKPGGGCAAVFREK